MSLDKFVWGEIVKDHEIGNFIVREYIERDSEETAFHVYIDGKDTMRSYESLDSALIGAIAIKYDGLNTSANMYFERAIDMLKKY